MKGMEIKEPAGGFYMVAIAYPDRVGDTIRSPKSPGSDRTLVFSLEKISR
jgi:hypothetical protein